MVNVQQSYREAMHDLGGAGRLLRTGELYAAGRAMVEARVLKKDPHLQGTALDLAVARIMYRRDQGVQKLLDEYESTRSG